MNKEKIIFVVTVKNRISKLAKKLFIVAGFD